MTSSVMILAVLGAIVGLLLFAREFRKTFHIRAAEVRMAELLHVKWRQNELEKIRDELLDIKKEAISIGYEDMERIYHVEHKINLIAVQLDQQSRQLIMEGLRQPSERGRLEYMLKLVNLSIATA